MYIFIYQNTDWRGACVGHRADDEHQFVTCGHCSAHHQVF